MYIFIYILMYLQLFHIYTVPRIHSSAVIYISIIYIMYHVYTVLHFHGSAVVYVHRVIYAMCIMYTRFHISTVLQLYIYTELYMQHVSYIHNSMFPWFRISIYISICYTYTWATVFPWFCSSMNLDSCNIHIHGLPRIHGSAVPWIWIHDSWNCRTMETWWPMYMHIIYWYIHMQNHGNMELCIYHM